MGCDSNRFVLMWQVRSVTVGCSMAGSGKAGKVRSEGVRSVYIWLGKIRYYKAGMVA
jgi:hypothetical protein